MLTELARVLLMDFESALAGQGAAVTASRRTESFKNQVPATLMPTDDSPPIAT